MNVHMPHLRPLILAALSYGLAVTGACGDPAVTTNDGSITLQDSGTDDAGGADTVVPDTSTDTDTSEVSPPECVTATDCSGATACTATFCDDGICGLLPGAAGTACNDDDPCTDADVCDGAGTCNGTALVCDDSNPCTQDACDDSQGCVHTATPGVLCDDGSACTENEVCSSAATCLGVPKTCSGGTGCMTGACNDATGDCDVVPNMGANCDDGDVCTVQDVCDDQGDCGGSELPCDDGVDCTTDACDPASGTCVSAVDEVLCDDGDACTTPTCDTVQGCVQVPDPTCCSADANCYDGDSCTADTCDLATNICVFTDSGTCCSTAADCGLNEVCVGGECFPGGDPLDFGFPRPATWVSNLDLGGVEGAEECCFDFDGDGAIDNAVGELAAALSTLLGQGGINNALDAGIQDGSVNLLFSFPNGAPAALPNLAVAPVGAFQGVPPAGTSLADKIAGAASFTVPIDNFLPGTALPQGSFGDGAIADSAIAAGPGKLYEVPLKVLYFDFSQASLELANIAGDLAPQGPGFAMINGKLGGVLPMVSVWDAINAFVDDSCGCLNLTAPLITAVDESSGACSTAPSDQVTCASSGTEAVCSQLNEFCILGLTIINPDYDLDGNGIADSMTIGIHFDGAGTVITGLSP